MTYRLLGTNFCRLELIIYHLLKAFAIPSANLRYLTCNIATIEAAYNDYQHHLRQPNRLGDPDHLLRRRAGPLRPRRELCKYLPRPPSSTSLTQPQVRTFGVSTKSYTFAAFTAAYTIVTEVITALVRWKRPMPILTSAAAFVLTWIFWLAASISVTVSTADGRSFCSNLDDLTNDPELKDLDPELLSELCVVVNGDIG